MEFALQEFRNHLVLWDSSDQPYWTANSASHQILRIGKRIDEERECHKNEEQQHKHELHQYDFPQGRVELANGPYEDAAERQLHPTRVCDLIRHLERNDDRRQRIYD